MSRHAYDSRFYDYLGPGAERSAATIVGHLLAVVKPESILDVGCGQGVWCAAWKKAGVEQVVGVDGTHVDAGALKIPVEDFVAHDLSQAFDLGRTFDLVMSLEVAEHLPASSADDFVDSLTRHGSLVMFSAAVPGQGGESHVNEQSYGYWRSKFACRGYRCFDYIRPRVRKDRQIEPWYRYNTLLFAAEGTSAQLPAEIRKTLVAEGDPIAIVAPLAWRLRNALLRPLPVAMIDRLSRLKQWAFHTLRQRHANPS